MRVFVGGPKKGFESLSLRPDQHQLIETEPLKPYPFSIQQLGSILYRSMLSIKSLLENQVYAETVSPVSPRFPSQMAVFKAETPWGEPLG